MQVDWTKYKAEEVRSGSDQNGSRLFPQFAQDYHKVFQTDVCPNCKDFPVKFQNFLIKIKMSQEESNFKLKEKYDGLPLEFGSQVYVTNANITNENALKLLKNHPKGKDLFQTLPDNLDELIAGSGNTGNSTNSNPDKPTSIKIFEKDYSIEEVKSLFEKAEVKSNASSVNGLQKAFDAQSEEMKGKIKTLLAAK